MVWQTHPRVRRPQVPNTERPTSVSSQATARGKLLPDSDLDTCTAHMRLHQTYWATWKRLLSSLVPAQLTGEPVPRSGLLPPSSMDSGSSRVPPHCPSIRQGCSRCCCPTLLLPGHLEWFTLCCMRVHMLPERLHAHLPSLKGCFVFLACRGRKLFFAA